MWKVKKFWYARLYTAFVAGATLVESRLAKVAFSLLVEDWGGLALVLCRAKEPKHEVLLPVNGKLDLLKHYFSQGREQL